MRSHKNTFLLMAVAVAIVVILGVLWYFSSPRAASAPVGALDAFARCLTQKGFTMYGLYSCPHCQAEKALFGGSFRYVDYVECSESPQECTAEKIDGVPTWIGPDGMRLVGTQSFQALADTSGCTLPTGD